MTLRFRTSDECAGRAVVRTRGSAGRSGATTAAGGGNGVEDARLRAMRCRESGRRSHLPFLRSRPGDDAGRCGTVGLRTAHRAGHLPAQPRPTRTRPALAGATEPAGHATPQGQWFEWSQSADTMVAGQPLGATAMTSAAGTSAERRDASATPLRRGDVVVLLGALLLFIDSFLPFYDFGYGASTNAWTWNRPAAAPDGLRHRGARRRPRRPGAVHHRRERGRQVGLTLHQLVGVLAVVSAVDLTLYVISAPLHGVAQWLGLVGAALLLVGSVLAKHVPALSMPVGASVAGGPGCGPGRPGRPGSRSGRGAVLVQRPRSHAGPRPCRRLAPRRAAARPLVPRDRLLRNGGGGQRGGVRDGDPARPDQDAARLNHRGTLPGPSSGAGATAGRLPDGS